MMLCLVRYSNVHISTLQALVAFINYAPWLQQSNNANWLIKHSSLNTFKELPSKRVLGDTVDLL